MTTRLLLFCAQEMHVRVAIIGGGPAAHTAGAWQESGACVDVHGKASRISCSAHTRARPSVSPPPLQPCTWAALSCSPCCSRASWPTAWRQAAS
jgi:hypothetical protein